MGKSREGSRRVWLRQALRLLTWLAPAERRGPQVEMYRATEEKQADLAARFVDWGIPTARSRAAGPRRTPRDPPHCLRGLAIRPGHCEVDCSWRSGWRDGRAVPSGRS